MVLVRGAINISQLASSACRMGNPSLMSRRAIATTVARAQQPRMQPTYGDVFNTQGNIRDKPITPEDTARARTAESVNLGQVVKGGTAAKMQSAVDRSGAAAAAAAPAASDDDFFSRTPSVDVAGEAFYASDVPALDEIANPGLNMDTMDVGVGTMAPPPAGGLGGLNRSPQVPPASVPGGGQVDHPVTIGEALEAAGENLGDKPVTQTDARVIQSAESRATGNVPGVKRVVAAEAQVAANKNNPGVGAAAATPTVQDVLHNVSEKMPIDKVVTHQDAARVQAVEKRNTGGAQEAGGISATLQSAADKNAASNFEPRTGAEGRIPKT